MSLRNLVSALIVGVLISPVAAVDWTPPEYLNSYATFDPETPDSRVDVSTDGEDTALSTWVHNSSGNGDFSKIYVSRSTNSGDSWSAPQLLFTNTSTEYGMLAPATVHLGGDQWLAAWMTSTWTAQPAIQQLYISRSTDNGVTWSAPQLEIQKELFQDRPGEYHTSIDADASGTVVISALSQILRSIDYGATWTHIPTPETTRNVVFIGTRTEWDLGSRIGYCGDGKWVNVFSRALHVNMDNNWSTIYSKFSVDNGATWSGLKTLTSLNIYYEGSLLGDLAVDGASAMVAVSFRKDISFFHSTDGGATWIGPGAGIITDQEKGAYSEVSLALKNGNAVVAWDTPHSGYGNAIRYASYPLGSSTWTVPSSLPESPNDLMPDVEAMTGNVFLLHYENMTRPVGYHVLRDQIAVRSTDGGVSWSTGQVINPGAPGQLDGIFDNNAHIAAGESGIMIAIWNATSLFGNGTVGHMAYATSRDYGITWGLAQPLNTSHATDGTPGIKPEVAYCGQGHWIAYWMHGDSMVSTLSADNGASWSVPQSISPGTGFSVLDSNKNGTLLAKSSTGYWRSDDFGATWQSAGAAHYGVRSFHRGDNSWITIENRKAFASSDNGFTWTHVGSLLGAYPEHKVSIDQGGNDGTLVATVTYSDSCLGNSCSGSLAVARSTDGGVTWTYRTILQKIDTIHNIKTAYLGGDRWISIWTEHPYERVPGYVVSEDNGQTWSEPALIEGIIGSYTPSFASADGNVTLAIGAQTGLSYYALRYSRQDGDVMFSNLTGNGPAAATDWQLFE